MRQKVSNSIDFVIDKNENNEMQAKELCCMSGKSKECSAFPQVPCGKSKECSAFLAILFAPARKKRCGKSKECFAFLKMPGARHKSIMAKTLAAVALALMLPMMQIAAAGGKTAAQKQAETQAALERAQQAADARQRGAVNSGVAPSDGASAKSTASSKAQARAQKKAERAQKKADKAAEKARKAQEEAGIAASPAERNGADSSASLTQVKADAPKTAAQKQAETQAALDKAQAAAEKKAQTAWAAVEAEENIEPITLTIEQAVAFANENSRTLKAAQIDLELKERAKKYSWNVFTPSVNASATASRGNKHGNLYSSPPDMGKEINSEKDRWQMIGSLGAQVNLSLAYIGSIKKAHADYEAGLITWEQTQRQTDMNIRKLFYGYLVSQESLKINEISLENARQRANQAAVNYRNGLIPELPRLDAEVTYENMRPDVEKARQELSQQLDTFAFLLGMSVGTKIELQGKIEPQFVSLNADELYGKYGDNNPDVVLLKKNIDIVDLGISAIDFRDYAPTLSIGWTGQPVFGLRHSGKGIAEGWGDFWDWDSWMDRGGWNITLAWNLTNMLPFTDAGKDKKDLKSNRDKLEIQLEQAMQNTEMEVKKNVDSLSQAQAAIESRTRNITLAQRSYDMAAVAYRNGRMELLDLRDKENSLNQAKLGLLSEQYNYLTYLLDLEYLLNTDLGSKTAD